MANQSSAGDDSSATRAAAHEPSVFVLVKRDQWRHARDGPFSRLHVVYRVVRQRERVELAARAREVVHLIVVEYVCSIAHDFRPKSIIYDISFKWVYLNLL